MNEVIHPPAIVATLASGVKAYQGRHGWYSVAYEEFLQMKAHHKKLLSAYLYSLKYWRIIRKTVKLIDGVHLAKVEKEGQDTQPWLASLLGVNKNLNDKRAVMDGLIGQIRQVYISYLHEYVRIRRPVPDQNQVKPVRLVGKWTFNGDDQETLKFKMTVGQYMLMCDILGIPKGIKDAT